MLFFQNTHFIDSRKLLVVEYYPKILQKIYGDRTKTISNLKNKNEYFIFFKYRLPILLLSKKCLIENYSKILQNFFIIVPERYWD